MLLKANRTLNKFYYSAAEKRWEQRSDSQSSDSAAQGGESLDAVQESKRTNPQPGAANICTAGNDSGSPS